MSEPTVSSETAAPPVAARPALAPVAAAERIELLDVLRGLALLGILAVNMPYHAGPFMADFLPAPLWPGPLDRAAAFVVRWLAEGKFYLLFSLLFGAGMALQMGRIEARGGRWLPLYTRRLLVLLAIGLLHATLLWPGDILVAYALLGFLLPLWAHRRPRTILRWVVALLVVYALLVAAWTGLSLLAHVAADVDSGVRQQLDDEAQHFDEDIRAALEVYARGSYAEATHRRLQDFGWSLLLLTTAVPSIFAFFLLGSWLVRGGRLAAAARAAPADPPAAPTPAPPGFSAETCPDPPSPAPAPTPALRWLSTWGLALGLLLNLGYAAGLARGNLARPDAWSAAATLLLPFAQPLLSLAYAALATRSFHSPTGRRLLSPLAAAGRMALTNYLLQSLIGLLLFTGVGLGLYGRVGPALGLLLTFAVFAVQVWLSGVWLRRFRFGPAEWLWRSLTYGRVQPFLRPAAAR